MLTVEEGLKKLGFTDQQDYQICVDQVDRSTEEKNNEFLLWQVHDGSKAGLLALPKFAEGTDTP